MSGLNDFKQLIDQSSETQRNHADQNHQKIKEYVDEQIVKATTLIDSKIEQN